MGIHNQGSLGKSENFLKPHPSKVHEVPHTFSKRWPNLTKRLLAGLLLLLLATCGEVFGLPPNSEHPSGRIDYAIAYVPFLHSVLMYGGWAPPNWRPTSEAWTWNGTSWSRLQMSGAPAFAHHTMALDSKRGVLVVCGRPTPHEGGEYQIWEYDGNNWSRKANVPVDTAAQGDPKLTYDTRRNRLVLYVASYAGDAEIWESDGKRWQHINAQHRQVRCDDNGCLFQYDESLRKAVLVGEDRSAKEPLGWDGLEWGMNGGSGTQTWLWDGVDWVQVHGEQPPRAMWGGITFDRSHHQLTLLTTRMETLEPPPGQMAKALTSGFAASESEWVFRIEL